MRKSYRNHLAFDVGAEDIELDHLMSCDVCDTYSDLDGIMLDRCINNPVTIRSERESEAWQVGWGLVYMTGYSRPPGLSLYDMSSLLDRLYAPAIVEMMDALNRPLFLRLTIPTPKSDNDT